MIQKIFFFTARRSLHHRPRDLRSPPNNRAAPPRSAAQVRGGIVHLRRIDPAGCRLLRMLRSDQGEQVYAHDCLFILLVIFKLSFINLNFPSYDMRARAKNSILKSLKTFRNFTLT